MVHCLRRLYRSLTSWGHSAVERLSFERLMRYYQQRIAHAVELLEPSYLSLIADGHCSTCSISTGSVTSTNWLSLST